MIAMSVLSVVWFTSAIGGALAAVVGLLVPKVRRWALLVAGAGFSIAGVLGILSIGILFLGLAAFCFIGASKDVSAGALPPPPSPNHSDNDLEG